MNKDLSLLITHPNVPLSHHDWVKLLAENIIPVVEDQDQGENPQEEAPKVPLPHSHLESRRALYPPINHLEAGSPLTNLSDPQDEAEVDLEDQEEVVAVVTEMEVMEMTRRMMSQVTTPLTQRKNGVRTSPSDPWTRDDAVDVEGVGKIRQ